MDSDSFNILNDEIDIVAALSYLWSKKKNVAFVAFLSGVVSLCSTLFIENRYESTAILAPSDDIQNNSIGGLASKFGGIASLAGVTLPSGGISKDTVAIEMMRSWSFIEGFIRRNNISVELMAGDSWDAETRRLKINPEKYDLEKKEWKNGFWGLFKSGNAQPPSSWNQYKKFLKNLTITKNEKTGLTTIKISSVSPDVAKKWLELLVEDVNSTYKLKEIQEIKDNIKYLKNEVESTNLSEMKTIFYQLIEEQTKSYMIARSKEDYVFSVVSFPMASDVGEEVYPNKVLFLVSGGLMGMMASLIFYLLRWKKPSES